MKRRYAFFLDRDGTINQEVEYLHRWEDFRYETGAIEALRILQGLGGQLVIVTNQSGVARGYYDAKAVLTLHRNMQADMQQQGISIAGIYDCPHHPDFSGPCHCRKPQPGMLQQAASDLDIDLAHSWIIGDKIDDIEAGYRAGCHGGILVSTGHGKRHAHITPDFGHFFHFHRSPNLLQAAYYLADNGEKEE